MLGGRYELRVKLALLSVVDEVEFELERAVED
jgi:hypothetical protein